MENEDKSITVNTNDNSMSINTNIADYSLDDLLTLLDINLSSSDDYENIVDDINNKIDSYVKLFESVENKNLVDFFEKVRKSLIGEKGNPNITEGERLLELYTEKDKQTEFTSIYGGNIPQTKHKTITKLLTIDSRFRRDYHGTSPTDFSCFLPYVINNVTEIRLSDLEFPATFYPFQFEYENNYFWVKFDYYVGSILTSKYAYFYIDPGNYYQETLIQKIQAEIDAEGVPLTISHNLNFNNGGGIGDGDGKTTIEYNGDTTLYQIVSLEVNFRGAQLPTSQSNYNRTHFISVGENDEIPDKIKYYYNARSTTDVKSRMGWMLGFRKDFYSGGVSYTSEGQLEVIGPRYLYIILDDHNTSANTNFFTNNERTILDGDIIARISVKAYAFSIQSQNDFSVYSEPRYYFGQVNIDKFDIKVVDEYNRTLILNGMDFSLTLQMKVKQEN